MRDGIPRWRRDGPYRRSLSPSSGNHAAREPAKHPDKFFVNLVLQSTAKIGIDARLGTLK
jgi:hypothetical protein